MPRATPYSVSLNVVGLQRTTYAADSAFFAGPLTLGFDGIGTASPSVDKVRLTTRAIAASAVPEPATWTMMLAGFGLVVFGMRRRGDMTRPACPA